ncbi:S-layer homology domain-containing protein [Paenibacillus sp. OV219]|uniref:S-layer homology domain-containing protein n=1 Tax=Paenibacillus sp. OV219 TaxID=1884377 RepID=UPI0008CB9634|nr:S-layer homology domain-containing protein [Paenibacillus sp. OV219]SEN66910.1 S-layer homology domain-containing protein [Paenibacillus sp. OV219]
MGKRRTVVTVTILLGLLSATVPSVSAESNSQSVQAITINRSKEEIISKWQQYKPMGFTFDYMEGKDIYEEQPSLTAPFKAGKLKQAYMQDGLKALNFVRYAAGLPDDVTLDMSLELQEQTGALINALNLQLSHTPSKPEGMDEEQYQLGYAGTSSSNLYAGDPTLYSNVLGYMADSDPSNISRVGHRRWIINPTMKKTMFGFVQTTSKYGYTYPYASLYAFNRERPVSEVSYTYVSWPSAGYFPSELFAPQDAWSVSLNPDKYDRTRTSDIRVTLTRTSDQKSWSFDPTKTDMEGRYFNVETGGYWIPFSIIFRPEGIISFPENEQFHVKIEGLYNKGGSETSLSFDTTFFPLVQPIKIRNSFMLLSVGEQLQLKTYQGSLALESSGAAFGSDHPEIVSVDRAGHLKALKTGDAEITLNNYFQIPQSVNIHVEAPNPAARVSKWAEGTYRAAKENGIVTSMLDHDYQQAMSRIEFADAAVALVENIYGQPLMGMTTPFTDIVDDNIGKALKNGLISGTSATTFSPWQTISRQEAASLLIRLVNKLQELLLSAVGKESDSGAAQQRVPTFADDAGISAWAKPNVYKAVELGLLSGVGQGKFDPRGQLTVEQTIAILEHLFERFVPAS